MYFESRALAAQKLLPPLLKYRYENTVVVALSDGGVVVGEQIATSLHCLMMLLMVQTIEVPGESVSFGTIAQDGSFSLNGELSEGQASEYYGEYRGYIEDQKREQQSQMTRLLGEGGTIDANMLREHNVIIVSDGLKSGGVLDAVYTFLKPIRIKRLVIAVPVVSVAAVDRMHILADELDVLSVTDNFMDVDHYYTDNKVPSHQETIEKINQIILNWR